MGGAGAKCFKLSFEFALEASDWPDVVITPLFLLMLSGDWRCWFSWNKRQLCSGPDPSRQSAPPTSVCAWPRELWTLLLLQIKVQVQQGCWERGPGFLSKPAGPLLFNKKKATRSSSWRHFSAYQTGNMTKLPRMSDKCQMILQMKSSSKSRYSLTSMPSLVWMLGTESFFL